MASLCVSTPQGNLSFNSNGIRNPNRIRIQQYRFNSSKCSKLHLVTIVTLNLILLAKQLQKFDIAFVELDQNGQTAGFHFYPGQSVETTWPCEWVWLIMALKELTAPTP